MEILGNTLEKLIPIRIMQNGGLQYSITNKRVNNIYPKSQHSTHFLINGVQSLQSKVVKKTRAIFKKIIRIDTRPFFDFLGFVFL